MTSFPVALHLAERQCLVVGSDDALLRARRLRASGAIVTVVTPAPSDALLDLAAAGEVTLKRRPFQESDLDDQWLVVLVDRDEALRATLGAACNARQTLFCAVDQPGDNSFSHVAEVRLSALGIAIDTGGRAPALAARLRRELLRVFSDSELAAFVDELVALRERTPRADRKAVLTEAAARLSLGPVTVHSKSGVDDGGGSG